MLFLGSGVGFNIGMPDWEGLADKITRFCLKQKIITRSEKLNLLIIFFNNINRRNIVKVINICLYELVKIFKAIDKIDKSENINDDIKNFLQKFPKKYEEKKLYI